VWFWFCKSILNDFDLKSFATVWFWFWFEIIFYNMILVLIWNHFQNDFTQHCISGSHQLSSRWQIRDHFQLLPAALSLCSIKSIKTHFYSAICRNESEAHVVICKNERLAQSTVSQLSKLFLPLCYEGFQVHLLEQPSQGNDLHLSVTVTLAVTYM